MSYLHNLFYSLDKLCDKWEPYLDVYEAHFERFRGTAPRILEIGVYKGGSAELWMKYFGGGTKITGVDINPECRKYETDDLDILIGNSADSDFWRGTISQYGDFDIIIDDGGHHMHQQKVAFECGWELLKDDGVFLIEDTHTSYWDHWPDAGLKNPQSFIEYSKNIIDVLTEEHQFKGPDGEVFSPKTRINPSYPRDIKSMHFYNSVVVFEKGDQPEFKRIFSRQNEESRVNSTSNDNSGILTINTGGYKNG